MNEHYAQIVVSLPWHDKVLAIPEKDRLAAFGLYSAAVCFCQDNLSDGRIRHCDLARVFPCSGAGRLAEVLVAAGLFDAEASGYRIHDYLDHNKSRHEVESEIEQRRDAARTAGLASARARAERKVQRGVERHVEQAVERTLERSGNEGSNAISTNFNPTTETDTAAPASASVRTSPLSLSVPNDVLGYWESKICRKPDSSDLRSLHTLCRNFSPGVVKIAIGQACVQGASADSFGLITTIAKAEVGR